MSIQEGGVNPVPPGQNKNPPPLLFRHLFPQLYIFLINPETLLFIIRYIIQPTNQLRADSLGSGVPRVVSAGSGALRADSLGLGVPRVVSAGSGNLRVGSYRVGTSGEVSSHSRGFSRAGFQKAGAKSAIENPSAGSSAKGTSDTGSLVIGTSF